MNKIIKIIIIKILITLTLINTLDIRQTYFININLSKF